MLRSLKEFRGYPLKNTDGVNGEVVDFYFDDHTWTVKHLEVDLGKFLPGKKVLLDPIHLATVEPESAQITTTLTCDQVEHRPEASTDKPIAEQWERRLSDVTTNTGLGVSEVYWMGRPYPVNYSMRDLEDRSKDFDFHLRSFQEVIGYGIKCLDSDFGRFDDLIVDTDSWDIRSVVVQTRRWVPGKRVIMPTQKLAGFDWISRKALVNLTHAEIMSQQTFYPGQPVNPASGMTDFYDYYGRKMSAEDHHKLAL